MLEDKITELLKILNGFIWKLEKPIN